MPPRMPPNMRNAISSLLGASTARTVTAEPPPSAPSTVNRAPAAANAFFITSRTPGLPAGDTGLGLPAGDTGAVTSPPLVYRQELLSLRLLPGRRLLR